MTSAIAPLRETRRKQLGSAPDVAPTGSAGLEVLAGLPGWWEARASAAGLSGKWLDVTWAVQVQDAPALPDADPLVGTAEQVGFRYVMSLPADERAQHGRHYSPSALADQLWAMTKRAWGQKRPQPLPGLVLDPACGAGALLLPVLREHLGAASRVDAQLALNALPNFIAGIDNDPLAVWLANVLLAAEMLPILARTERARRKPLPALVRLGDGLAGVDSPVRAVIMNPPYGRVRLSPGERSRFSEWLYGHANLYGLFMAAAVEALDAEGVLAALVPTSFLAGRYFENLRGGLAQQAPLREIGFVADRSASFADVLQETCLATFSRKRARRVAVVNINGSVTDVAKVASPRVATPWLLPRRADDAAVAAAAIAMPLRLADAGWRVSTGPLVWNRRRADLSSRGGSGRVRVLWGADLDGGAVHRDPARDSVRFLKLGGTDARILLTTEPCLLAQRTTAPEQSRRLVTAYLDRKTLDEWGGRVVVENHVNVLVPARAEPLLPIDTLRRLFATEAVDRVLRCLSGSVAVSAYEMESLPLPAPEVLASWFELDDAAFDQAVAAAYRPPSA